MNAMSNDEAPQLSELEFRAALIERTRLEPDAVDAIMQCVRGEGLTFADAAQKLGLVDQSHIDDARDYARLTTAGDTPSLVETALRKLTASHRDLVLRQNPPVKPGPSLLIACDPYGTHSEKVRALRTDLLLLCEARTEAAAIGIVSAQAGEGRSQIAAELAVSFSQLGRNTLLVDADLRKPTQHTLFGALPGMGLTDALVHKERPVLHPVVGLPNLWLLTAGTPSTNPLELLSDGRFQNLMGSLRREYDFIIIDTPPVIQCADALAVTTIAGRALFVTHADHTSYAGAKNVLRRLDSTQAMIMGAVINRF